MSNSYEYEDTTPDYEQFERNQLDLDWDAGEGLPQDETLEIEVTGDAETVKEMMGFAYNEYQGASEYFHKLRASQTYIQGYQCLLLERIALALENPIADPRPFESVTNALNGIGKALYSKDV